MESQHFANRPCWILILYGVSLSFIAAFTPFFEAGYLFKVDILLAGLTPYLVYALAVPLMRNVLTTSVGIVLVVVHTVLVVSERFLGGTDFSNALITLPIAMAVLVIPLVVVAIIKTDVHHPGRKIIGH